MDGKGGRVSAVRHQASSYLFESTGSYLRYLLIIFGRNCYFLRLNSNAGRHISFYIENIGAQNFRLHVLIPCLPYRTVESRFTAR